jgi:uncharacterized protein YjbI with pentapeptide repeats
MKWVSVHTWLVAGPVDFRTRKPRSLFSNRIVLPGFDVVANANFDSDAKIEAVSETVSFRHRDLRGAVLIGAKMRKVVLTAANLQDANLEGADLRETRLDCAPSEETKMDALRNRRVNPDADCANAKGGSFNLAQLQGATLSGARLQGASFIKANLASAYLSYAQLQGATFWMASMQTVSLFAANLDAADLSEAKLPFAALSGASLRGASLVNAALEGSWVTNTHLEGARLDEAQLHCVSLNSADVRNASMDGTFVWRTDPPQRPPPQNPVEGARFANLRTDTVNRCDVGQLAWKLCRWDTAAFEKFKESLFTEIPPVRRKALTEPVFPYGVPRTEICLPPPKGASPADEAREKGWVAREGNSAEGRDQYATRLSDVAN